MEAPRGARRNVSCQGARVTLKISRTHSAGSMRWAISRCTFMIFLQQGLRDLRFELRLMVELLNEPFGDLRRAKIDIGLHSHIHLRTGGVEVARQPRKTVDCLADRVQSGDGNVE